MRVAIVCIDTRGGIQPYVGLGAGLRMGGHEVIVIAPENYREFITTCGLEFRGIEGNVQEMMESADHAGTPERGFLASHRLMIQTMIEKIFSWTEDAMKGCQGADLVLGGFGGMVVGESVSEKLGIPFIQAHLQPLADTNEYSGVLFPDPLRERSGWLNRLSHKWTRQVFWQPFRPAINAVRTRLLGLSPAPFWGATNANRPILFGYSPHLLPRPMDFSDNIHVTGYWFLDSWQEWTPPTDLVRFLESGSPPIAVGFGSMGSKDTKGTTNLILDAAADAKERVVLISGWGGMKSSQLPDNAILVDSVPHSWLFSRVSLSVHHGGAGTTGATLRAGIPSVVVPFGADQPFWGWLVAYRGLGSPPIQRKRLTAKILSQAIKNTLADPLIRGRVAKLGRQIREEDGVAKAIEILESYYSTLRDRDPFSRVTR